MRSTPHLAPLLAALLALCSAARGQTPTTIDVRAAVTLPAGAPVLLRDVATLAGPDADRIESAVLLHADQTAPKDALFAGPTPRTLTRDELRRALDVAGINWARTLLRSQGVTITFTPAAPVQAPLPTPAPASASPSARLPRPPAPALTSSAGAASFGPRSVHALLLRALADAAGIADTAAVSMRTDGLSPADLELLASTLPSNWTCSIRPQGASASGRTTVRIEAFDADRTTLNRTIVVDALVKRTILVAAAPGGINRDQPFSAGDLRLEPRALPITESARLAPLTPEQFVGSIARRRIDPGRPITPADATPPRPAVVITRGDDVWVTCTAGGITVKVKAKALTTAREGDRLQLQPEGSKKSLTARATGPGEAVVEGP
ncbi:MAG: flagellar basal body P-ring formation chaperone FlgA, partial [Phycisphaerales bacterium]|nr:flagellar basal body P-ring formation chaperone FlgA [Phycisphaerales bacterium]